MSTVEPWTGTQVFVVGLYQRMMELRRSLSERLEHATERLTGLLKWFRSAGEICSSTWGLVEFDTPTEIVASPSIAPAGTATVQRPFVSEPPMLPTILSTLKTRLRRLPTMLPRPPSRLFESTTRVSWALVAGE